MIVCSCRTPLIAAVTSNFINLGLDLFLMFVLGWGVAGAGTLPEYAKQTSLACSKH